MILSVLAIGIGAAFGAVLRWVLGTQLNALFPFIPPGTLAANLLGGYLIGVAIAFFAAFPALAPEWRLLVITGFLGGLTTFSTFSAEANTLLLRRQTPWAFVHVVAHLAGTLALTMLGIVLVRSMLH